jgi:hypothetical protein
MGKKTPKASGPKLAEPARAPTKLVQASLGTASKPMGKKAGAAKSPETKVTRVQPGVDPKRPATAASATKKTSPTTRQLAKS